MELNVIVKVFQYDGKYVAISGNHRVLTCRNADIKR